LWTAFSLILIKLIIGTIRSYTPDASASV